jgi:hypothetical protein
MSTQLSSKVQVQFDFYFAAPSSVAKYTSVLHLARRDVAQCFGYDPNSYDVTKGQTPVEDGRQVLWPGAMTIFAAIDLLGKFFAGTDLEQSP